MDVPDYHNLCCHDNQLLTDYLAYCSETKNDAFLQRKEKMNEGLIKLF